ncbi:TITAN-like protein isoform X2 [Mercurialis annua]|uniref:TITAN-like protein isoform X2 n=1 Tax=Mercurialis annua TaxID=3986 RepID=UPI00215ED21B|nr:TITAN-like protein isoform X2 [Mercurialis annua]
MNQNGDVKEFEFCKVCKHNHDEGQRHKYFPKHKKFLSAYLSRFQNKLADVKFFLKNPSLLRPEHSSTYRFWCVFCDTDVNEIGSSFACANAINHLASDDHWKNLKHFMWKYGGKMDCVDTFRIMESDLHKWEKKCKLLDNEAASSGDGSRVLEIGPSNDIQNELNCRNINEFENNNFEPHKSNFINGVMPLQYYTNEYQISHSAVANVGPFVHDPFSALPLNARNGACLWNSNGLTNTVNWNTLQPLPYMKTISSGDLDGQGFKGKGVVDVVSSSKGSQHITQISALSQEKAGRNVHTGAPPPWLEASEENQLNVQLKPVSSSISSLSNKPGKKLNPNRVGAAWAERRKIEMEMEKRGEIVKSNYDTNWLPNFGRVWQSGSRKESRKEFEKDKMKLPKVESQSEVPVTIQPYISKKMRRDASN